MQSYQKMYVASSYITRGYTSTHALKNTERGCKNGTQKRSGQRRPAQIYPDCKAGKKHQRPTEGIAWRYQTVTIKRTKGGEAVNFKETMDILMKILAMVDKIYHAVVEDADKENEE